MLRSTLPRTPWKTREEGYHEVTANIFDPMFCTGFCRLFHEMEMQAGMHIDIEASLVVDLEVCL